LVYDKILTQIQQLEHELFYLWDRIQLYYQKLPYEDMALQIIAVTILVIFLITVILSLTVIMLRSKNSLKARRLHKLEAGWDEQLMAVIFAEGDSDQPVVAVRSRYRLFFLNYLYQYAQRLQGLELERIKHLATPYLPLIARGVRRGYPELRARNINILGTFGMPRYIDVIKIALQDKSPIVSMSAAWALALPEYPEHCRIILPVLNMFDNWSMNFLASLLAGMGSGAAVDLRQALMDPQAGQRVRIACAEALRILGDLAAADPAAHLLDEVVEPELQAALLRLLGQVGVGAHRAVVKRFLEADTFIVRLHALSTIGRLGVAEDGELIRDRLADESNWVALHAARTLLALRRKDILESAANSGRDYAALARQVLAEERAA